MMRLAASLALAATAQATTCDLFETGGTPCVAAHSTVRALYKAFDGESFSQFNAQVGPHLSSS